MRLWFWLCLIGGVVGSQICLWLTVLPLGIPGEWTWHRVAAEPDLPWNLLGLGVAAALYVGFVEAGSRRLTSGKIRSIEVGVWLIGLVAVAFTWLWVVQECAPIRNRLGKSAFVLYYSASSGYFTRARYENPDPREFLSGYEALMRAGDVLHVGTHPPGLFLIFHGMIEACRQSTELAAFLDATQPPSFREACDVIARNSVSLIPPRPLLSADRRVLWLATLLVLATASAAVLPLFALVRRTHDAVTAWWAAALWPAIPAVAVFAPKSDVAYAFVGLLMVGAWLAAVDRRSLALAFLAGLLVWCGLMMSLAFLPVLLFMAIVGWKVGTTPDIETDSAGVSSRLKQWTAGRPPTRCLAAGLSGFVIPTLLMGCFCRVTLFTIWRLNYQNHAGFYVKYSRTYWQWLLVNPLELTFAVGWPVALLAACVLWNAFRFRRLMMSPTALAVMIVWGSLWLTGQNSGEAARLWIVFLPWLVLLSGDQLAELDGSTTNRWLRPSLLILATQLVVSALTVARVNGFAL